MYLPTRSASFLVEALTLLWTEKPEWRQPAIFLELLPKELDENKDYRVEIIGGGATARINILNKDKFLLARIILMVN